MTDIQTIRKALTDHPLSTVEELAEVLGWTSMRVRKCVNKLMGREEAVSAPKRYELTAFGAQRTRHADMTDEDRAERRRQKVQDYNQGRRKELLAARREQRRAERLAAKQAQQAARPVIARIVPAAANDEAASKAIANRHPLAMAWGGVA